jgi:hypothetical protein
MKVIYQTSPKAPVPTGCKFIYLNPNIRERFPSGRIEREVRTD